MRYEGEDSAQSRMADTVRGNPLPLAIVGVGLGWLAMNLVRGAGRGSEYSGAAHGLGYGASAPEYDSSEYAGYGTGMAAAGPEAERGRLQEMRERAGATARDVRERASEYSQRARVRAREMAHSTRERMGAMGEGVRHRASDIADRSTETFREHPLMLGAVSLLVGAAVAVSLPRTRREDRMMARTRGEVMSRARELGADAYERAKRVASRTVEAARTSGAEALEQVKHTSKEAAEQAFGETRDAARKEAERQNLTGEPPGSIH